MPVSTEALKGHVRKNNLTFRAHVIIYYERTKSLHACSFMGSVNIIFNKQNIIITLK